MMDDTLPPKPKAFDMTLCRWSPFHHLRLGYQWRIFHLVGKIESRENDIVNQRQYAEYGLYAPAGPSVCPV